MKIYVITKGAYSDYHICGVATDPDIANELAKKCTDSYDTAYVEVYDTEDNAETLRFNGRYFCQYHKEDNRIEIQRASSFDYFEASHLVPKETRYGYYVTVNADDDEMALKKASDIFAKYRAEKMGL